MTSCPVLARYALHAAGNEKALAAARAAHDERIVSTRAAVIAAREESSLAWTEANAWTRIRRMQAAKDALAAARRAELHATCAERP